MSTWINPGTGRTWHLLAQWLSLTTRRLARSVCGELFIDPHVLHGPDELQPVADPCQECRRPVTGIYADQLHMRRAVVLSGLPGPLDTMRELAAASLLTEDQQALLDDLDRIDFLLSRESISAAPGSAPDA